MGIFEFRIAGWSVFPKNKKCFSPSKTSWIYFRSPYLSGIKMKYYGKFRKMEEKTLTALKIFTKRLKREHLLSASKILAENGAICSKLPSPPK